MDSDDGAVGEAVGEDAEGFTVVGVVEGRHEDGGVADVKICVTGGEADAIEMKRLGHGEADHLGFGAIFKAGGFEALAVFFQRAMVDVGAVGFVDKDDALGRDEAGEVVDVRTARVPAGEAR